MLTASPPAEPRAWRQPHLHVVFTLTNEVIKYTLKEQPLTMARVRQNNADLCCPKQTKGSPDTHIRHCHGNVCRNRIHIVASCMAWQLSPDLWRFVRPQNNQIVISSIDRQAWTTRKSTKTPDQFSDGQLDNYRLYIVVYMCV